MDTLLPGLLRGRLIRRLLRGVFVSAAVPDSILLRAMSVALVVPPGCFVTDRCAGWLHGADMALAPNEDVLVPQVTFFRPSDEGRLRNGLCVSGERRVARDDLVSMARLGGFDVAELVSSVSRLRGQRGVVQLRELAPIVDAGSESFGESATRRRWHGAGLPWPTTQISVVDEGVERYRLDLGLEELRWAVEYAGRRWHTTPQAVARDAERVEWLETCRGYQIDEFDHTNLFGPGQDADARLRAGYQRARDTFAVRRRRFVY